MRKIMLAMFMLVASSALAANNTGPVAPTGNGGNGGSGGGAVYGPDKTGVAPTQPPLFIGGVGPDGNIKPFTFTASGLQMFDQAAELALGAPGDTMASVGGNGSAIAQLKQTVNQLSLVLAQLKATLGVSGTVTSNIGTTNGLALDSSLATLNTNVNKLFPSGGSIANTAFGINGTLPNFANVQTFNVGTTGGLGLDSSLQSIKNAFGPLALDSSLTTLNTNVNKLFPAGGSIGNTAFGINGTLPNFANVQTFNIGTTNGLGLDSSLQSIITKLSNALSTTDTNVAAATAAAGSTTTKALSFQRSDGKLPLTAGDTVATAGTANDAGALSSVATNQRNVSLGYGFEPVSATWYQIYADAATHGLLMKNAAMEAALGAVSDVAATVTGGVVGNGSEIAQLKAAVNQLAAINANQSTLVIGNSTAFTNGVSAYPTMCGYLLTQTAIASSRYAPCQSDVLGNQRTVPMTSAGAGGVATATRIPSTAAGSNQTSVKTTPGRLYKVVACNTTTTAYRIKFYNALTANVTLGTTVPVMSRPFPAAASGGMNCQSWDVSDLGWYFSTAITANITAGAADNDNNPPAAAGALTDVSFEIQ